MLCSVCGIEIGEDDVGDYHNRIPLKIEIDLANDADEIDRILYERVIDTFGKTTFGFCFVCWLKSLGVKEK